MSHKRKRYVARGASVAEDEAAELLTERTRLVEPALHEALQQGALLRCAAAQSLEVKFPRFPSLLRLVTLRPPRHREQRLEIDGVDAFQGKEPFPPQFPLVRTRKGVHQSLFLEQSARQRQLWVDSFTCQIFLCPASRETQSRQMLHQVIPTFSPLVFFHAQLHVMRCSLQHLWLV